MKVYKGFDKNMKCRGFQFEEGKTYELPDNEDAVLCQSGFHACENPLNCWDYYNLIDSEFHEVELDEISEERHEDTKIVGRKITIGAKLDIRGMVKASIDFVMKSVKGAKDNKLSDDGGSWAQISSSGSWAQISSSGNWAQIGSSGNWAKIGSSGYGAKIGSSGNWAQIDVTGERSIAACVGNDGKIRAKIGDWIVLSEWENIDGKYTPVCVKSAQIDGEMLKEDVWYMLKNGEFVEADNGEA